MTTSPEGHSYCTCKNFFRVINLFTENMEVQLIASITNDNSFNDNNNNKLIALPSKSLDSLTLNQSTIENNVTNKDSCIKIRETVNNIIIHMNQDESTLRDLNRKQKYCIREQNVQKRKSFLRRMNSWNLPLRLKID